jgi:hypothetical protein
MATMVLNRELLNPTPGAQIAMDSCSFTAHINYSAAVYFSAYSAVGSPVTAPSFA